MGPGGTKAHVSFPIGEETRYLKEAPKVVATVRVDRADQDTRAVISAGGLLVFGLAWVLLINLRRVVSSARAGDPFHPRNVTRLRWVAAAVVALMWVVESTTQLVNHYIDVDPPVQVVNPGPSWWALLAVSLGFLALSEVFREGARLRESEEETASRVLAASPAPPG